jgi:general secretion pathway protein D
MKLTNRWHSIVVLVVVTCMLAMPVTALGKKGREHYDRGLKYELAQQWEKAAQEFTLALAADPSNVDFLLHYRRAVFNASQAFMQQGRSLAEQRDYIGAYNAFRQAFGYDPVNQLAVSEMERMVRLQEVKEGGRKPPAVGGDGEQADGAGTPATPGTARAQEPAGPTKVEVARTINWNGDLRGFIRKMADELNLNVIFDRQSFATPRNIDLTLRDVTTAKAIDYVFLQENLFFQKLDRRTILVADQTRRQQYQQLVVRTFYISNSDPDKAKALITQALPASVGRPQSIVVSDKDTNSLTVRDTAENVKLIGDLLQSIDKDRAEVVMDVNIYEVQRSDLLTFGNQLGPTTQFNVGGSPGLSVLSSSGVTNGRQAGVDLSSIVGLSPTALAAALVIPPMVFNAFQSRNNAKLLASTQIHAFNNEESTARIGQRVPVQTAQAYPFGVQTGTTTNTQTGFPSGGFPVINYEPTGLTLNFTPQVFPNLDVQVKMKIESKDVTGANTLTPTFTERVITGTARVQNNRTMMLASVSTEIQANGRAGLPFISGLPILGRFFTSPTKESRQVDIVIAVTPRVLRAPAVTPRDEEMRPSGTLTSPTTGSIATMLLETEREEQIAAARRIPKDVVVLADPPTTYQPASAVDQSKANHTSKATEVAATQVVPVTQTGNATGNGTAPQTQNVALTGPAKQTEAPAVSGPASDSGMPQPKSAAFTAQTDQAQLPATKTLDVTSALKSVLSPATSLSKTSTSARDNTTVTPAVEQLAPKAERTELSAKASELSAGLIQLSLAPEAGEMKVREKRQLAVQVRTGAPLGLAVLTLRFDPRVLKVNSVTTGSIFSNAKTGPTLTYSIDRDGMLLISLVAGAGTSFTGEGTALNIEFEGLAGGDSALAFDLANIHLVASDGRSVLLQVEPIKLTVK